MTYSAKRLTRSWFSGVYVKYSSFNQWSMLLVLYTVLFDNSFNAVLTVSFVLVCL